MVAQLTRNHSILSSRSSQLLKHRDTRRGIKSYVQLLFKDLHQPRRQFVLLQRTKPESFVEWCVPRKVSKGRQRNRSNSFSLRPSPRADRLDQGRSDAPATIMFASVLGGMAVFLAFHLPAFLIIRESLRPWWLAACRVGYACTSAATAPAGS